MAKVSNTLDMTTPLRAVVCALLVLTLATVASPSNGATPNLANCNKLQSEHVTLTKKGIATDLEKGPEWAKSNLPANRVNQILRYLHLDEQIRFRCQNIFAEAEEQVAARQAAKTARVKALANIPPPPQRAPPPSQRPARKFARSKAGLVAIPPLPVRAARKTR